jgi:hypothetical protein
MTLIDTGPLVALVDKGQGEAHKKCAAVVKRLSGSLITTWPCLTEAMHFLRGLRGWQGQMGLWQYVKNKELILHSPQDDELLRVCELMEKYQDTPMDFADASLVSLAELRGVRRIFTIDSDFYVYRIHGKESFEVIRP